MSRQMAISALAPSGRPSAPRSSVISSSLTRSGSRSVPSACSRAAISVESVGSMRRAARRAAAAVRGFSCTVKYSEKVRNARTRCAASLARSNTE